MPTNVETTREFDREAERLGRKYPAVFDEIEGLISQIESDIRPGSSSIGRWRITAYKVACSRIRQPDGAKSGGFRLLYYLE